MEQWGREDVMLIGHQYTIGMARTITSPSQEPSRSTAQRSKPQLLDWLLNGADRGNSKRFGTRSMLPTFEDRLPFLSESLQGLYPIFGV